ncbi:hypothetical protein BDQ17DRAFT_1363282 [Cyathus striatus]|nr:hypothetical protein BDQ17DRAFT_1363282 [Cyathus striatus]
MPPCAAKAHATRARDRAAASNSPVSTPQLASTPEPCTPSPEIIHNVLSSAPPVIVSPIKSRQRKAATLI